MRKSSRLLLFLLINILLSTFTTLTVLWLWERAHPRPEGINLAGESGTAASHTTQQSLTNAASTAEPIVEFDNENVQINIRTIVGAGDLAVEYVEIVNQGQNPADLSGWRLIDENGNHFTFPALILNRGGAIKVLSKTGTNTVIELYWQADVPMWQSGETARLANTAGEIVSSYSIP